MKPPTPLDPNAVPDYQAGIRSAMAGEPRPPATQHWKRAGWDIQTEPEAFDQWLKETAPCQTTQHGTRLPALNT
jgi:hypothetical protein